MVQTKPKLMTFQDFLDWLPETGRYELHNVVFTSWPDDYARKFEDYEALGIREYWIVDYLGLGGRRYIGSPKQPTITVCRLVNDVYETQLFRAEEQLVSKNFSGFQLQTNKIFGKI